MADSFDGGLQLSDEERRIINILKEVGDELDNDPRIKSIIREVATGSVASLPYNVFTQLIREFVALVVSSTKVSAEMLEKIVRIFIKMWRGPELSSKVLQEMYPGTSVDDSDTVDGIYIPQEVTLMDPAFIEKFKHLLKSGRQQVRSIRLMVVGMFGVGKTSLVENLVQREEKTERKPPESTVGIDVTHCNIRDGKWSEINFNDNMCDKFVKVGHNPIDVPIDDVDAGYERSPNEEDVPMQDGDGNYEDEEILYKRTTRVEEEEHKSKEFEPPIIEAVNTDIEEQNMKSTKAKDDDPKLHENDFLKSNSTPHSPTDSTISIWDFAGQTIYYSTHHFFLNSRSIYLLMMDVSIPLNDVVKETSGFPLSGFIPKDFTCLEAFKFWLNSIHMYSTQVDADIKPSVILVGTKKDKLKGTDEEKDKHKDDYFDEALLSLTDSPAINYVHEKKFLINNLDKHEDFRKIREEVVMLARDQRYWGEWRPARWITLERSFLGLKSRGKEIITFDEAKDVNREKSENPIQDENEEDLRLFLTFQHQLGNILYYDTDMLKNYVILSPQWIIEAFRCFIRHVKDKRPRQLKNWFNYEKKAILTQELINEIMDKTEFQDYKKQVIEYMEYLDMIAKPIDAAIYQAEETEQGNDQEMKQPEEVQKCTAEKKDTAPVHSYIFPSLLKLRPERNEISELINSLNFEKKTPILCFKFTHNFMPPSVFHRLLAVCIRNWEIVKIEEENRKDDKQDQKGKAAFNERKPQNCFLLFNGFAVFRVPCAGVLSIWFQDHIIYTRVFYSSDADKSIPQKVRKFLSKSLTEILRILPQESRISKALPFEEYIQCPACVKKFKANTGLLRMREFFNLEKLECHYGAMQCTAKKDEVIGIWCYKSLHTKIPNTALDRRPTAKELARVSRTIGYEYQQLAKKLGLERAELDHIKYDHKHHLQTQIYYMLDKWQSKSDGKSGGLVRDLRNHIVAVDSDIFQFDNVFVTDQFKSTCIDMEKLGEVDLKRKPSDKEIVKIANEIGGEYRLLGVELGIKDAQLHQHREDNSMATTVKCILDEWNRARDSDIEYLGKAMYLANSNMKAYYKVFSKKLV